MAVDSNMSWNSTSDSDSINSGISLVFLQSSFRIEEANDAASSYIKQTR